MKRWMLIAVCFTVILPASPAVAKKHKKMLKTLGPVVEAMGTGNLATAPGQESTATATCPSGKQAVGGGFRAPFRRNSELVVHSSYRSSPSGWTAAGQDVAGTGAVMAFAFCRNASAGPVADVTVSSSSGTDGQISSLAATCPAGTRLIGGGFQSTVPPAGDAVVSPQVNQATSPATWTVTGVQDQNATITLTAHAYCLDRIPSPVFVSGVSSASGGEFASMVGVTPQCPIPPKLKGSKKGKKRKRQPAKRLSGGGFSATPINGASGAPIVVFGVSNGNGDAGQWLATGFNDSSSAGSFSVTSQGVCL